jgi:tetratricopeptide (TPR) repeat protein
MPPYFSTSLRPSTPPAAPHPGERFDLWLLGPYFGLHEPGFGSLHAAGVAAAYAELDPHVTATPFQLHPPTGMRRLVAEQIGHPSLANDDPAALDESLWTPRWKDLVERISTAGTADDPALLRLAILLCALGLDALALRLLASVPLERAGADDLSSMLAMKRTHITRRALRTSDNVAADRMVLAAVATADGVSDRLGLTAALTLAVLASRGKTPEKSDVDRWRSVAAQRLRRLSGTDWRDGLAESTYWRAVSFQPFLSGDHSRTAAELDRAEELARGLLAGGGLAARQNMHPLLETRTRAALAGGDTDDAVRYAGELTRLDPYDGKVWISHGDALRAAGDPESAVDAYRQAVVLGAPYAPKAQYELACTLEATGELPPALDAYLAVVDLDPRAYSGWHAARRLADRLGRSDVLYWADEWATQLTALRGGHKE